MKPYFITGIDTGVGKTIVSSILVEKLNADYWKPVQSGDLDNPDTEKVKSLVSNTVSYFYPEIYRLTQAFSPHKSAALDGVMIQAEKFQPPDTNNCLFIEGAGGLMVPLNDSFYIIDLIQMLGAEVVLVSKNYLGSINHTLLSVNMLQVKNIAIKGIVFNGVQDEYSESVIRKYSKVSNFANIPHENTIGKEAIIRLGRNFDDWNL